MNALIQLVNIKPKAIVVNKANCQNVPIHSAICDCVRLAMTNEICAVVELVCDDATYVVDGDAIIDQIHANRKLTTK